MDRELNPFKPGSGLRPPALEGRDQQIDAFDLLVARAGRRNYNRGMALSGLRGVGKTTLLNTLSDHAERHGWLTITPDALDMLIEASGGYPYFLQEFGKAIWNAAATNTSDPGRWPNALGSTTTAISDVRDSAMKKGLVWSPERGRIAFSVPGMADFIRRQPRP